MISKKKMNKHVIKGKTIFSQTIKSSAINFVALLFVCNLIGFSLILTGCSSQVEANQIDPSQIIKIESLEVSEEDELSTPTTDIQDSQEIIDNNSVAEEELPSYEVTKLDAIKYATTSLNVRSGPGKEYDIIGYFIVNEEVNITGEVDNGWYQVDYLGEEGFAYSTYLADEKIEVPVVVETPASTEVIVAEDTAELTQIVASTTQDKNYILNTSIDGAGIVFIGDSRTVAMYNVTRDNNNLWVAAVGKGRDWFVNYGSVQADPYIVSGTKVVINLGVNDTRQVNKYITNMNEICQTWIDRGASIYYLSVNPLDYSKYVTNDDIVSFNSTLSAGLIDGIKWIDSYSYLIENGYTTVDGLHFSKETSLTIYDYCLSNL